MATYCYPSTADWRCLPDGFTLDPDLKETAEQLGWASLRALTGFQTGGCPVTVRPCRKRCSAAGTWYIAPVSGDGFNGLVSGTGAFSPRLVNGAWYNACGCGPRDDCSCSPMSVMRLPGPIAEITEIKQDGAVLPASSYRVVGNEVFRLDGEVWPLCQDLAAADTEPNTLSVTYVQGYPVDEIINIAAGRLAMEFYFACTDDSRCALPSNAQMIVRQGVTIELAGSLFNNQMTGLPEVDVVIATLNPFGLKVGPQVWTPDGARR